MCECIVKNQPVVKLLALPVESQHSINAHVDEIYGKAGRKRNALARLSKTMNVEYKLRLFYPFMAAQF